MSLNWKLAVSLKVNNRTQKFFFGLVFESIFCDAIVIHFLVVLPLVVILVELL